MRGGYENKGIARIERFGDRWVLSVQCNGTHKTYLDDTTMDLSRYAGKDVRARYQYVDRSVNDPKCFQAPCRPVHERRVALGTVTVLSPDQARRMARQCEGSRSRNE